jgi:glycosyltransferase involved in cell wall biosynthesis
VSESTADLWRPAIPDVRVVRNGIDLDRWHVGPGGGPLVWFGRMVPEKGPDLAIRAALRAGVALQLAGPVSDPAFFAAEVEPLLDDRITYVGHLDREELVTLIGGARAVVVTPRWDEPYGLVAAESLSCGTPVIGFARGGLPEVVDPSCSVLVPADDVDALAATIPHVERLSRVAARARAEDACSMALMLDRYEEIYLDLVGGGVLAA